GEEILVEWGMGKRRLGFSVTDNSGLLAPETVLDKLYRQITREGVLDVTGRGIYLTCRLSSSMIVNIEKKKRTQFVLLFDEDDPGWNKPLHIYCC
ncbi:MAG: hypothetical protein V2A74_01200, partial [bacterium]